MTVRTRPSTSTSTDDGKVFRTLSILDKHSRECLAFKVKRKLNSTDVIDALTDLFILRGVPVLCVQTMGRNLSPKLPEIGKPPSAPGQLTLNLGAHGRTDTAKASMAGSGMSYSTAKSSTSCAKLKLWLSNGGDITSQGVSIVHWAIAH